MRLVVLVCILYSLISCSLLDENRSTSSNAKISDCCNNLSLTNTDFLEHLEYLGDLFITENKSQVIFPPKEILVYLEEIMQKIIENNESFFLKKIIPEVYLIKSDIPLIFSVPKNKIFLSTGLVLKYIKYENLLVATLSFEMIRIQQSLYTKRAIVPVGFIRVDRLMYLLRLTPDIREEINKWAYLVMKRAGFDAYTYLNWLQIQNKNAMDFFLQLGDAQNISREEFLFKKFLFEQKTDRKRHVKDFEGNSSRQFYKFNEYVQSKVNRK